MVQRVLKNLHKERTFTIYKYKDDVLFLYVLVFLCSLFNYLFVYFIQVDVNVNEP